MGKGVEINEARKKGGKVTKRIDRFRARKRRSKRGGGKEKRGARMRD